MKWRARRVAEPTDAPGDGSIALVLGNYRAGLAAARQLKRLGYRVVVGSEPGAYCADRSRSVDETWHAPAPGSAEFPDALRRYLADEPSVSVIMPVLEPYMDAIAALATELEERAVLALPSPEIVAICHDKYRWFTFSSETGVENPAFGLAHDLAELRGLVAEIGGPVVIKPVEGGKRLGRLKAITVSHERDLDHQLPAWPLGHRALMVQRRFEGDRYNIYFAARDGRVLRQQTSLSLRTARADGSGQTIEGITTAPIPTLSASLEKVTAAMSYTGVGCAQYLYDDASGESCFLEINPRFGASHTVVEHIGMGLTRLAIELAGNRPEPAAAMEPFQPDTGTRFIWSYGDIAGLAESRAGGDITRRQAIGWLAASIRGLARARVHVTWSWKDPRPALSIPFKGVGNWLTIKTHRPVARSAGVRRAKG